MRKTFLVTGGTGRLGALVVGRLRQAGHEVRVVSRRTGPRLFTVDWKTGAGLTAALDGVDVVVHCASAPGSVDMDRRLVKAAADAHVSHLLYISIVGVDRNPLRYYRTKLTAERIVEQSGVPYTILRATQFHDLIRMLLATLARIPLMPVPDLSFQPVDVSEVADRFADLAMAEPAGRVADMGGPQVLRLTDMARAYLEATGRRRPIVPFRLPGKVFGAFRAGYHRAPDHADGRITFADHLATHSDERTASDRGRR